MLDGISHRRFPDSFPLPPGMSMLTRGNRTLEEYRRFTGSRRNRAVNELMIEAFDKNAIIISEHKPDWLWLHK